MGLTRPRASQIYNLDYKQAARVVATVNITLTGGAPSVVDGVSLTLNDRVLVTGQNTASQNGIYTVATVGSGSTGTWTLASDVNSTGEVDGGMIVMVTEGTQYADTQWKLTTNNPITVGTTALTFVQNYSGNSISAGTSNVSVNSSGNVTISSAGTANVLAVSSTGIAVSGLASVTGNITGSYFIGNGSQLTGISASGISSINNGTSNVAVATGSNVTIGVAGTVVTTFASTGEYVTGVVSATGNIVGSYIIGNGSQLTGLPAGYTNANTATFLSAFGSNTISTTGNITAGYVIGNGSQLTGLPAGYTNANVSTFLAAFGSNTISTTGTITAGNITGGNISATSYTGTTVSVTGNVTASGHVGIIYTNSVVNTGANATGNIGSSTGYFNTVFATASKALYADLAEMYVADAEYTPGTVVEFGGNFEITESTQSHTPCVAGIISTNPSYLMNSAQSGEHVLPVALTGRVPCRVVGTIYKGDRLATSGLYPGVATRLDMDQYQPGCIIGKALENYQSTNVGTIEVAVGRF